MLTSLSGKEMERKCNVMVEYTMVYWPNVYNVLYAKIDLKQLSEVPPLKLHSYNLNRPYTPL